MSTLGTLAVSIVGDPRQLEKSFDGVNKKINGFSKNMKQMGKNVTAAGKSLLPMTAAITGAVVGIVALANKTGQYADRVLDLTAITGMSTDAIQEWQYVAGQAGVSTEAVTAAVEGLVRRMPQLEAEGGRATEQLAKLGLTFDDLNNMDPGQMVDTLIDSLADMEDPIERNAIGAQLFGNAWKDIAPILAMGAEGIEQAKKEAHELGAVMSKDALEAANEYRMEMEKFKTEMAAVGRGLAMDFIPILQDVILPLIRDKIVPAIRSFVEWIGNLAEWFRNLSPQTQKFVLAAVAIAAALGPVLIILGKVIAAMSILVSPIGLVIAAVAALIAIVVLLVKNWETVVEFFANLWESIKQIFHSAIDGIVRFFVAAWEGMRDFVVGLWRGIADVATSVWNGIIGFFGGVRDRIVGIFTAVRDTVLKIWDGMVGGIKAFINAIIKALNWMIDGLNKISVDIPDWVPGLGGKKLGFSIANIPYLARGGDIVRAGAAIVGERGPELLQLPQGAQVRPLEKAPQPVEINVTANYHGIDKETAEQANDDLIGKIARKRGLVGAYR